MVKQDFQKEVALKHPGIVPLFYVPEQEIFNYSKFGSVKRKLTVKSGSTNFFIVEKTSYDV
jgi:hypothetical protein